MRADDANNDALRWCLLLKFPDYYNLDQDLCSVDVEPECLLITLQKSQDSIGLWNKLYVGTNEKELKVFSFKYIESESNKQRQLKKFAKS